MGRSEARRQKRVRGDAWADEQMNENKNRRTSETGECVQQKLVSQASACGARVANGQCKELSIGALGDEVGGQVVKEETKPEIRRGRGCVRRRGILDLSVRGRTHGSKIQTAWKFLSRGDNSGVRIFRFFRFYFSEHTYCPDFRIVGKMDFSIFCNRAGFRFYQIGRRRSTIASRAVRPAGTQRSPSTIENSS